VANKIVKFDVSSDLIRDALAIPEEATIYDIHQSEQRVGSYTFYVVHPDLPEIGAGDVVPEVSPIIRADYDKKPSVWLTWDWRLDVEDKEER